MDKILHVVGIMNVGGIETWLMNVLRNIDRTEMQFDFAVHTYKKGYYDDEIEKLGGTIIRVPKFNIINLYAYKKAWRKILRNNDYKIIHTHIRSTAPIYLKIAKRYDIKTIAHAHSTSNGKFPASLIKCFFQRNICIYSDIRLACSNEAGIWLFKNYPFKIVKNAIDISLYNLNNDIRTKYRQEYDIENSIVVGHVGRFNYAKNHIFLLDIFSELYKKNKSFKLILVGDGELRVDIEKKLEKLNIINNVIFTGVRSEIPQLLQMFDIFVFPSRYEGLPVALLEAQASGLQCFISDTISNEVIITKQVHQISLKESSIFWADQIINKLNVERANNFSYLRTNGFDIKIVAKELQLLYQNVLENKY